MPRKLLGAILLWAFYLTWGIPAPAQVLVTGNAKITGNATITSTPPVSIAVVQALAGNNFSGCSGVTTCDYAYGSNVGSNHALVVAGFGSAGEVLTISGSGAGCSSTSWGTPVSKTLVGALDIYVWAGIASGSGPCTAAIGTSGTTDTVGVILGEYSGVNTSTPIDTNGTGGASGVQNYTLSITAGSATSASGDYGIAFWASNFDSNSPTASSWTSQVNQTFIGAFSQASITNGTTVTFSGSPFNTNDDGGVVGVMITLLP